MLPSQAPASQRDRIIALATASGAKSVCVFGSAAMGIDRAGSDVDLLVNMPAGTSLLRIVGLQSLRCWGTISASSALTRRRLALVSVPIAVESSPSRNLT